MGPYWSFWVYMGRYKFSWVLMGPSGSLLACLHVLYGSWWVLLGPFLSFRVPVGPYGFL